MTNWEKAVALVRADFGIGSDGSRIHGAGGGPDHQGERIMPRYRPRGGVVKGSGGYS